MSAEQARDLGGRLEMALGVGLEEKTRLVDRGVLADAGEHVLQRAPLGHVVEHVAGRDQGHAATPREPGQRLEARGIVAAIDLLRREIARLAGGGATFPEKPRTHRRSAPAAERRRSALRHAPADPRARAGISPFPPAAGRARSAATAGHRRRGRSGSRAASAVLRPPRPRAPPPPHPPPSRERGHQPSTPYCSLFLLAEKSWGFSSGRRCFPSPLAGEGQGGG